MGISRYDYDENGNPEILDQPVIIPDELIYSYLLSIGVSMVICLITSL